MARTAVIRAVAGRLRVVVSAMVLAAGMTMTVAGSAQAAVETHKNCDGYWVKRCVWLNYDTTNDRARAYVEAWDRPGEANWDVRVADVHLEHDLSWDNQGFREVAGSRNPDYDGWKGTSDYARGALLDCSANQTGYMDIRAKAYVSWKRSGDSGGYWIYSPSKRVWWNQCPW